MADRRSLGHIRVDAADSFCLCPLTPQQLLGKSSGHLGDPERMRQSIVGIPVKVNIGSGGKPNGVPERR